jgi:hypothetical protein
MTARKDGRRPPGPAKYRPSTEERQQIITGAAAGLSQNKIAKSVGRSRTLVQNTLNEPETQAEVSIEKAELAELYRQKARDIVVSIDATDISKASLQQKAISSGVLLDKSLLLSGEPTEILAANVGVLMDVVEALRSRGPVRQGLPRLPPAIEAIPTSKASGQPASQDEPQARYFPVPLKAPAENR